MKHKLGFRLITLMVVLSILALMACSQMQNWPQFRGPESNMVVTIANLPEEWGNDNNIKWTTAWSGSTAARYT